MAAAPHRPSHYQHASSSYHRRGGRVAHQVLELSHCLLDFVAQLSPTREEISVKEDVRKLLERLIRTIEPSAKLLSFGSTANGLNLKNSDMDLCCVLDVPTEQMPSASQFVLRAAQLLERETKFSVKPLPNARIPIIKLSLQPSPSIPFGIACDIGFENRLALENTRLLYSYAAIDPRRVRTMILFLKLWSKRRKINSPYHGTLSSYGYALLVIFFLVHVKDPPVLPNLQQMPPMRPISPSDTHINGRNVWFFDDSELLRQRWQSPNTETIGELLLDFFRYFSRDFNYAGAVASIRAGHLPKDSMESNKPADPREGTSLWIEDPFETSFNVGRCVTRDGLYTIRGEFMRAVRILSAKYDTPMTALALLCEERENEVPRSADQRHSYHRYHTESPRSRSNQGSNQGSPLAPRLGLARNGSQDSFKPQFAPSTPITITTPTHYPPNFTPATLPSTMVPPPHMAPQRGKWTSPPPDHAPPQRHNSFNERLASGIKMAVTHPPADRHPTRSSSESSVTEEEADEILDRNSLGTRSSSPISSTAPSVIEMAPSNKPLVKICEPSEIGSTPTPKPTQSKTSNWPQNQPLVEPKRQSSLSAVPTLPNLTIPPVMSSGFPSPNQFSNGHQWMQDYPSPGFYIPHSPSIPSHHSHYREGPGNFRGYHNGYSAGIPFTPNHNRSFGFPHLPTMVPSIPQQLPTPPVSSPCLNVGLIPSSPTPPIMILEEPPSTSA
ncbi:hypothetical protein CPB86DRAFT_872149 [Serendipita vermifera]|nr:hypothetical protein CPB86DRAFT_872149 [Serendipita vermifera]